jgi:hypothetical protein
MICSLFTGEPPEPIDARDGEARGDGPGLVGEAGGGTSAPSGESCLSCGSTVSTRTRLLELYFFLNILCSFVFASILFASSLLNFFNLCTL